ncbi:Holliday junction ATP-dependent DNA helicase RuvA [Leptospira wolffii]|uniref:Holliday junction branch migration complex subunit RuvA n=1 Tax=Leptospira wolffii TaxID=409998 RepID=A0A2M9ZAY9_9LEPT|nr:Holliday junction branch migration protein RuvA [Leptospira wolffii]EPG66659.1 Holliday junction DNA helicase RuvA [Leptospira wolffii serovar Khorat str. Khorat-H2]PJZ65580.1 Holliday junction ATP-dependent DNA helicase RuvA [Leptospira wolffii]TGK56209.1 Holliday junction ATP-dependent DNA helicase RuvA [Leptospira wolffii]TGK72256.1 Holliday junction ATP-dependent DNA helicase RuvA [Leptospira wolffii]TGK72838.1 Holliday junction ATP-dependent DNA helicase RuvA [Leptospira wolffii]
MISGLQGNIIKLEVGSAHIDVQGVTYEVTISFKTYWELKDLISSGKKEIRLHIHHSINERGQRLFGFLQERDKEFFKVMKGLHGIGEMTALKVLSFFSPWELHKIASSGEAKELEKIPKVRAKTSEKIFFEVKQNLKKLELFLEKSPQDPASLEIPAERLPSPEDRFKETAVQALVQLGFDDKSALKEVEKILKKQSFTDTGELIREILKSL